uniref:Uncharacterized protein n=1 Tax=Phocoena sinus TaxID=42100 RepID=A0A8C9CUN6_PHOSS
MIIHSLSFPYSCSTLRRKIATLCDSFTTKSLNEHIFPPLMHRVIFFNFFKAPFLVDLKKPELKIPHTVSFYIKGEPRDAKGKGCSCYEAALHDGNPITVYLHGGAEHKSVAFAWIVATNAAKVLEDKGFPVDAIILEAPFTNIWVARINYPLLKLYEIAHSAYRNKERVKTVIFPPGLQHTFLCKSTTLLKTVR